MNKKYPTRLLIISALFAFLSTVGLELNMAIHSVKDIEKSANVFHTHGWFRLIWDIKMSLGGYSIKHFILVCLLTVLFVYSLKIADKRIKRFAIIPGAVFAFFEVFGKSFKEAASWNEVIATGRNFVKAGIKYVGLFLLFYAISVVVIDFLKKHNFAITKNELSKDKCWFTSNKKSILVVFSLIILMWLPHAVADFPGITNYDFFDMLDTYYGNDTNSLRVVIPISDEVTLNNNNPVLQTMMAVIVMKIGNAMGSPYIGLGLFCYLQMIIFALILSYSIYFLSKHNVRTGIRVAILLFYGLLPWHGNFAMATLKDTNFSFMMILYLIFLADAVLNRDKFFEKKSKLVVFALINLLLMLLRNNGVYVLIVVSVILIFAFKKMWKKIALATFLPIFVYMVLIVNILYPALKISPGSSAEMYSVPIQQIARLIKEHDKQIATEDKDKIKKVLNNYDEIAKRYNPELSDPVKSRFNKYATKEDLSEFLGVWAKYLLKYPSLYIQATMNNCYGYFYPEAEHWLVYSQIEPPGKNYGLESPKSLTTFRKEWNKLIDAFKQLPGFGMFVSIGFYTWIMIMTIVSLVVLRRKRKILLWVPIVILMLTVFVGPANTMPRYVYPLILSTPMLVSLSGCADKESEESNEDIDNYTSV